MAAIPACGWLAHELFQSRKTTWLTLALSTFFPQRVALGLAPLSSIMFAFLILMTMASFVRWLRTDSRVALLMGALFGVLTSTVRYEGWLFNAGMILIAAGCAWSSQTKVGWKFLVLFGLILLSYPVVCARSTFLVTKPANALVADSQQHSPRQVMQKNPIAEFVVTNAVTLNLAGMISVVQCIREKSWRYKAIIAEFFGPLIAFSMVLLLMWSAQPGPAWRDFRQIATIPIVIQPGNKTVGQLRIFENPAGRDRHPSVVQTRLGSIAGGRILEYHWK